MKDTFNIPKFLCINKAASYVRRIGLLEGVCVGLICVCDLYMYSNGEKLSKRLQGTSVQSYRVCLLIKKIYILINLCMSINIFCLLI